jgi:hypothetical protein
MSALCGKSMWSPFTLLWAKRRSLHMCLFAVNLLAIAAVELHGSLAGAFVINTDKPLPGDTVTAVTGPSESLEFLALREGV